MRGIAIVTILGLGLVPRVGLAQPSLGEIDSIDAGAREEAAALSSRIDREYAALAATSLGADDCTLACKALTSMVRAMNRLCALDAGARCRDARAKVSDATERVRAVCPECVALGASAQPAPPPRAAVVPMEADTAASAESVPPRRGCASCTVSSRSDGDGMAIFAIAGLVVARSVRRRKRC